MDRRGLRGETEECRSLFLVGWSGRLGVFMDKTEVFVVTVECTQRGGDTREGF